MNLQQFIRPTNCGQNHLHSSATAKPSSKEWYNASLDVFALGAGVNQWLENYGNRELASLSDCLTAGESIFLFDVNIANFIMAIHGIQTAWWKSWLRARKV